MDMTIIFQNLIDSLSIEQLVDLQEQLGNHIEKVDTLPKLEEKLRELRFSDGLVCPHCGKPAVVCNGSSRGRKRYRCKQCGKSFGMTTKTVFADSKLGLSTLLKYADCMGKGLTLRKAAKEVGISLKASFFMRHKLLGALSKEMGVDTLSGTIEMDETYFAESFTGNHKKQDKAWIAPRKSGKSRKRGKEVEFRGISHQQVCVSVGMDREQNLVIMPVGTGRLTTKQLSNLYGDKVGENSIICTDSHNAYSKFATEVQAELKQIERGKHKNGIYHINHVNALHNGLKLWFKPKYGVSTKYLRNYCYWFNLEQRQKGLPSNQKSENMLSNSILGLGILSREDIRRTVPFAA